MYRCIRCKKITEKLDLYFVRCKHCAGRILVKVRAPVTKTIKAE